MGRPQGFDRGRAKVRNRRMSRIAVRAGKGRLTGPTADVQAGWSELLLMPRNRPSPGRHFSLAE